MALIQPKDLVEGDIFELLGLQNLPEDQKEELMTKIIEGVESRVALRIDDLLDDKEKENFHQLLNQDDDQAISEFLQSKDIKVAQLAAEEALFVKSEILETAKAIKE